VNGYFRTYRNDLPHPRFIRSLGVPFMEMLIYKTALCHGDFSQPRPTESPDSRGSAAYCYLKLPSLARLRFDEFVV